MADMSPLRRRMIKDMTVRNLSPATQRCYVHAVMKFSRYFGRSPELTPTEEERLFANLREDYHPMVRFALLAGVRLGNIVRLTWRQVDFEAGQITIKMKSKKPGGRVHTVPITPGMRAALVNLHGDHPIYVFTYVCHRPRVSVLADGRKHIRCKGDRYPFSLTGWRKPWAKALTSAKIEDFRFHDTRHTAATRIVRKTGNLKVAQRLLGHADLASTTRYAHVTQDDVFNALEAVESRKSPKGKNERQAKSRRK